MTDILEALEINVNRGSLTMSSEEVLTFAQVAEIHKAGMLVGIPDSAVITWLNFTFRGYGSWELSLNWEMKP